MLMGNKKLEEMLQEEAKGLVEDLLKRVKSRSNWLKSYVPCPDGTEVRTTQAGVKTIEGALNVFVEEYLKEVTHGASPCVTLEYENEKD